MGQCMGTAKAEPEPLIEHLEEETWSALGAQVEAIYLYDRKGRSLAPLRPHLRADRNCGRVSFWKFFFCGVFL